MLLFGIWNEKKNNKKLNENETHVKGMLKQNQQQQQNILFKLP